MIFNYFSDLNEFNEKDLIDIKYINPIRILVYCQNITDLDLRDLRTNLKIPPFYYFLILNQNDKSLKLFTFENRDDLQICHEIQQLKEINEFSSNTQKWTTHPIFPKKYKNFYKCSLKLGVFFKESILESILF